MNDGFSGCSWNCIGLIGRTYFKLSIVEGHICMKSNYTCYKQVLSSAVYLMGVCVTFMAYKLGNTCLKRIMGRLYAMSHNGGNYKLKKSLKVYRTHFYAKLPVLS